MPSPNVTVASGATRRRRPPTTATSSTSPVAVKVTLAAADAAKTPRPTSKLRKPIATGQYMRSTSPVRSPRPPPPPGIAPTGRANARPARQPRTPHTQSTPSIRKSPLAQMREEYDELKRKNNEYVKKMARQEEELRRLKAQLLQKPKSGAAATITKNRKNGDGGCSQEEILQAKEELIHEQDVELCNLRQRLEEQLRLQVSLADEPTEKEKEKEERSLLEKLRMEKEIVAKQLVEMAKELEELRQLQSAGKGVGDEDEDEDDDIPQQLAGQLEAQRVAHEESLKQYEAELAEKDKLLLERGEAIDTLKAARDEALRDVRTAHSKKLLELKHQHEQEMKRVLAKLAKADSAVLAGDTAKLVDNELQRILEEFEQNYTHPVLNEPVDQVRPQDTRHVERSQSAHQIKTHQANWLSRFLPTEAVSWPAPQPLSILKKTTGPKKSTPAERIASAAIGDYAPILTPIDPMAVQVYISTVSGNPQVKYRQEQIQHLLRAHRTKYELVDVASSVSAFQYMKRANNNGSNEGRPKELPQLFVGGEYRGQFEEVLEGAEAGTLDDMLRPAAERDWTPEERATLQRAEAAAAMAPPPPVRVLPSGPVVLPTLRKTSASSPGPVRPFRGTEDEDEDEALLRELEREIKTGKATAIDIADL